MCGMWIKHPRSNSYTCEPGEPRAMNEEQRLQDINSKLDQILKTQAIILEGLRMLVEALPLGGQANGANSEENEADDFTPIWSY